RCIQCVLAASLAACSDCASRKTGKKLGCTGSLVASSSGCAGGSGSADSSLGAARRLPSHCQHSVAFTPLEAPHAGQVSRYLNSSSSLRGVCMINPFDHSIAVWPRDYLCQG